MYVYVLPQLFTSISNYEVRTMPRDVKKLTKPEEEKEKARQVGLNSRVSSSGTRRTRKR